MAVPPIEDEEGEGGGGVRGGRGRGGGGGVHTGLEEEEVVQEHGGGGGVQRGIEEVHRVPEHGGGGGLGSAFEEEDDDAHVIGVGKQGGGDAVEGDDADAHKADDGSGSEEEEEEEEGEEDNEKVLARLKALCNVLGSNYQEKLDEVGIVHGVEITQAMKIRLLDVVFFLEITKKNRFEKMKESAKKLVNLWEKSEQHTQRLLKVYQIFYILSASSSDMILEEKYLSTALMKKIEKEITSVESEMKDKFQRKKKKFLELVKQLHLTASDVGFDPKKKVDPVEYPKKTQELRGLIKKLKKDRILRMQLVVRMELIDTGRKEKFSLEKLMDLIRNAKEFLEKTHVEGEICFYDGIDVLDVINEIEAAVNSSHADSSENSKSSRSVRLATRLKKKELDSSVNTVQEAAADLLKCPRKCRSGIQRSHPPDEAP